jgi:hypothetical protein
MNNKWSFWKVSCTSNPPRVWWCATGPLAFLPIHTAGIYSKSEPGFNISDYVVSSYTPTLAAIINARESHQAHNKFWELLAISQPCMPGQSALPNTEVELNIIKEQATKFGVHSLRRPEASMEKCNRRYETTQLGPPGLSQHTRHHWTIKNTQQMFGALDHHKIIPLCRRARIPLSMPNRSCRWKALRGSSSPGCRIDASR